MCSRIGLATARSLDFVDTGLRQAEADEDVDAVDHVERCRPGHLGEPAVGLLDEAGQAAAEPRGAAAIASSRRGPPVVCARRD